tara:strand:- start:133 stop:723 length:591 start_codon:yes stop_codon:yes gene_type:complete
MYAKIENNIVVKVNSSLASFSKAAPAWDAAQRAANGIYEVVYDSSNKKDERFYINGAETLTFANDVVTATYAPATGKKLDDTNVVDEDGEPLLDDNGVQVVTLGLKSIEKKQIKNHAAGLLQDTDWYVVRNAEAGTAIPAEVATFRTEVRTKSGTMETAIDGAASIEALEALFTYTNSGTDAEPNYTRPLVEFPEL